MPPHARQSGTASPASSRAWTSSRVESAPQARQRTRVALPCSSMTFSGGMPARWWRLSMFCVMTQSRSPRVSRAAIAWWAAFGAAARTVA